MPPNLGLYALYHKGESKMNKLGTFNIEREMNLFVEGTVALVMVFLCGAFLRLFEQPLWWFVSSTPWEGWLVVLWVVIWVYAAIFWVVSLLWYVYWYGAPVFALLIVGLDYAERRKRDHAAALGHLEYQIKKLKRSNGKDNGRLLVSLQEALQICINTVVSDKEIKSVLQKCGVTKFIATKGELGNLPIVSISFAKEQPNVSN